MKAMPSHHMMMLVFAAMLALQQHAGGATATGSQDEPFSAINPAATQAAAISTRQQRSLQLNDANAGHVAAWGNMTIHDFVPTAAAQDVIAAALCSGQGIVNDLIALALLKNQTVIAWGNGGAWVPANATANVTAIAGGSMTAIALLANGTVVGLSDVIDGISIPKAAQSNVEAIWVTGSLAAARLKDGALVSWRNNAPPDLPSFNNVSKPYPAEEKVIGIAGINCEDSVVPPCQVLTLRANGSVVPWDGISVVPIVVQSGVTALTAPALHAIDPAIFLALLANGSIVQWSYTSPTQVEAVHFPLNGTGNTFKSISASWKRSYAVTTGGSLLGWSNDNLADTSSSISANAQAGAVAVIAGNQNRNQMSLVLKAGGLLVGFDGSVMVPASASVPVSIRTGATVTQIAAGRSHALALQSDGHVQVWGDSSNGQLQIPPQLVDVVVTQVAAAGDVSFAVTEQGAVYAWGDNSSNLTNVPLEALTNVVKVATGPGYALALLTNGSVISWGAGPVYSVRSVLLTDPSQPQPVLNISATAQHNVVDIAAGYWIAVAVHSDGSMTQWGEVSTAPKLQNVTSAAAGLHYAAAVLSNGTLVVWHVNVSDIVIDQLDLGFARNLKVRKVSLTSWYPDFEIVAIEWGLVLLDNGTVIPMPFTCFDAGFPCLKATIQPADVQSGVSDITLGAGFALALKTDVAPSAAAPGSPSQPPPPVANQSATISLLVTIPTTSKLATNNSLQLQFSKQLTAALTSYFQLPTGQVAVQLQVLSATQRRLQQARVTVQASANITATWPADNSTTPAFLQQQADQLQQQPSVVLPTAMVQQFDVDTTHAMVISVDTSQLRLPGPSFSPPASPNNVPPNDVPSSPNSNKKKISTGAIAGIAIACVVGVAAAAALAIVMYRRHNANAIKRGAALKPFFGNAASAAAWTVASSGIVTPAAAINIPGVSQGEVFMLATAQNYVWVDFTMLPHGHTQPVQAGVNDTQLDMMLKTQLQEDEASVAMQCCPTVQLSMKELRQQVHLLFDGLLGRGATALVFKCVWPCRFGPNALLAAKVVQNGFESDMTVLSSFVYEANLLAATQHPHVVKLYGYCLEPPTVCLILELLPCSLKDVLYKSPSDAASSKSSSSQPNTTSAAAVPTMQSSNSNSGVRAQAQPRTTIDIENSGSQPVVTSTSTSGRNHSTKDSPQVLKPSVQLDIMTHTLKPVTLHQIVRVCTDVAAGLAHLHNQPAPDATVSEASHLLSAPSAGGRIVHRVNLGAGTLPYMAPELLVSSKAGVSGAACTNRVDIYSLGIIMWELLMGQPPWKGMAPAAILAAVMNRRRLPLPGDMAAADREHATMELPLLHPLPAHSHPDLPKMCQIIQACWQHRELRRPTAAALHGTLAALLQQLEQQEQKLAVA